MAKNSKTPSDGTTKFFGFAIREPRPGYYMADRLVQGQRLRRCFNDIGAAKLWCQQKNAEIENKGAEAVKISDAQRIEFNSVQKLIEGRSVTLTECVEYWLKKHPDATGGETWSDTAERYLKNMETENKRRPASIADKRLKLAAIGAAIGTEQTDTLTERDITEAVKKVATIRNWTSGTMNAHENAGLTLLRFYQGRGKRMKANVEDNPPETWTPDLVQKMLHTAQTIAPELLPGLAVMIFAGLRPTEAARLQWDQVNLEAKIIYIPGSQSKTGRARNVSISENLREWLRAYPGTGAGGVLPSVSRTRTQRERVMRSVGLAAWGADTPRHTAGTYMYAQHGGDYVTRNLGHSMDIFLKHYQGHPPTADQVKKFWKILPKK